MLQVGQLHSEVPEAIRLGVDDLLDRFKESNSFCIPSFPTTIRRIL